MSELVLPIALWNGPPPHSITSTLFILGRSVLVTGSSSGQICIWSIETEKPNKEGGLTPLIICMGHNAPIIGLVECNFEGKDAFISISTDGVMHVWSAQDGKCIGGTQFTTFYPLYLVSIPSSTISSAPPSSPPSPPSPSSPSSPGGGGGIPVPNFVSAGSVTGESRLIALAGSHSDIEIIDAWTLKSTATLRGHSDWVTCLGTALVNGEPVLMSGSRDGLVHFWSLKANEDFPLRTVCFDEGPIIDVNPLAVVVSPDVRSFVLVTQKAWFLYTAQNSRLVCAVSCPQGAEWLGAKYLDSSTLLAWTSNALAAAYRLSIPAKAEPLSLIPSSGSSLVEIPKNLSATFDIAANGDASLMTHAGVHPNSVFLPVRPAPQRGPEVPTTTHLPTVLYTINEFSLESSRPSPPPPQQPPSREPLTDSTKPQLSTASETTPTPSSTSSSSPTTPSPSYTSSLPDPASQVHRYESSFSQFAACTDNFFAVGDTSGHVGMWIVRPDNFTPWCGGRVSDGWKGVEPPAKPVTTSLVIEDLLLLVRGHENGQISTCNLPTDPFPKYNKAHAARVNCLMCSPVIGSSSSLAAVTAASAAQQQKRFLISGSDDFTIKVWELATFELLHTFTHHTGPITWLFPPPPRSYAQQQQQQSSTTSSEHFWDNTFFAVSEDKCVGLYSMDSMVCRHLFGVHPALVHSVKSRREQDYLLVECVDGCVAIWEMGTGELEGIVYGQVARDISENSDTIWTSHSHPQGALSTGPVTGSVTEPNAGGGAVVSGTGVGVGASGVGVRMTFIPNLLHRTPIQILFLDVKQIIRELYRTLASPAFAAVAAPVAPSASASSSSSSSQVYKKPLPTAPSTTNLTSSNGSNLSNSGDIRTSGQQQQSSLIHAVASGVSSAAARYRQSLQITSPNNSTTSITSLPAYQVFSYLIPWGVDKSMDALCKKEMMLRPPVPDFAFGIKGDGGNISVLVPSASGVGRWQCSPELTALITLSAVSMAKALLNLGDGKNSCIQILSYYCALLPETLGPRSTYVDPSLPLLASYWLDPLEDIMSAARSILVSTIDRLSPDNRRELTQSVALQLKQTAEGHTRGLLVVVLGIIGAERPEALDEFASRSAAIELLKILYKGGTGPFTQAAVELLGKGFASWRAHVKDVARLIRGLFTLSLQADSPVSPPSSTSSLGQTAHHALMLIGAQDPKQFILCIGAEIHRDTSHSHTHTVPNNSSSAVMVLGSLVKKDPCALLGQLPRLVETVVKSLDPHTPALRDACLKATTAVLHVMVKKYPMVSFHQESQRLAVGTSENVIIIYDLKTATRWHVLEGHKSSVSAVAFNDNGKALSSYSIMENAVRIWQTGTSFFGILGSQPQCVKTFSVSKPTKPIAPQVQLETVRLQWASPSTLTLFRGWEQGTTFNVDPIM